MAKDKGGKAQDKAIDKLNKSNATAEEKLRKLLDED